MQGVGSQFLEMLGSDQRSALKRALVAAAFAAALAVPAYALAPWEGLVVHAGGAVLGLVGGHLAASGRARAFEASLKGSWSQWMRYAVSCESVAEVHRKVRGRSGRNLAYLLAATLTLLWGLEVALLAVAFQDETSLALAVPVLLANGAAAGALVGYNLRMKTWTRTLRASVSEMVDAGELGVWGVV